MSHDAFSMSVLAALAAVAILMIVVALPVVLSMRHAARDREFQHAERLKALEMGRPLPGDPSYDGTPRTAGTGIGVWVPISALVIALASTTGSQNSEAAAQVAIWLSAGGVGVTGLICGTVLATRTMSRDDRTVDRHAPAKHRFEESEIDTVSRRGL